MTTCAGAVPCWPGFTRSFRNCEKLRAGWLGHTVRVNKSSYLRPASDLAPVGDTIGQIFESRVTVPCDKSATKPGPEA
jgi:hypothetical protein